MTYTVNKINLDGSLSHKELMNNLDEVNAWLVEVYGKFASIQITQDQTGKVRRYTDNGMEWERF